MIVAVAGDELEAELMRSRLAADGIASRIAYRSNVGYPASIHPRSVGVAIGSFEVRVAPADGARARGLLDAVAPETGGRPRRVVRVIAALLLGAWLISVAYAVVNMLPR